MPEALAFFRSHGVPAPDSPDGQPTPGRYFGTLYAPVLPDHPLHDGETVRIGNRELVVVWTPGPPPGTAVSTSLRTKVLVVGDHLLPKITPHVGVYHFGRTTRYGIFSIPTESAAVRCRTGFTGAWGGVKDHRHRAQQIIQHHKYRLQEMHDTITGHARTAYEVAMEIFDLGSDRPYFLMLARPLRPWPTSTC